MTTSDPSRFLPLSSLAFHLLLALGDGPAHGYAIGKQIELRSDGALSPTTGSLYQAIRRLTDGGLIEAAPEAEANSPDPRRQYFQLTPLGRRVAGAEARRMQNLVRLAQRGKLLEENS
jgi:DNA-binding PadR family transcriptional regulator